MFGAFDRFHFDFEICFAAGSSESFIPVWNMNGVYKIGKFSPAAITCFTWKLRGSLSLVNHQPVSVRVAKCRPTANLCFSWPEEERNFVFAQVFHC